MTARFYTRHQCPLCEQAWDALDAALARHHAPPEIRRINIDSDPELVRTYGWRVPVLVLADGCEFDLALPEQLVAAIEAAGSFFEPSEPI